MKTEDVLRIVHKATHRTRLRVGNMLTRLVIDAALDSAGFQELTAEALKTENLDKLEHMQPGGLTHVPLPGAEGVMLSIGGSREVAIALGVANRDKRPKGLAPGETALYLALPSPIGGLKVLLKVDGSIELNNGTFPDATSRASKVDAFIATLDTVLRSWVIAPTDGGLALQTAYKLAFASPPGSVASPTVKTNETTP